jgi:hypothetical protein
VQLYVVTFGDDRGPEDDQDWSQYVASVNILLEIYKKKVVLTVLIFV